MWRIAPRGDECHALPSECSVLLSWETVAPEPSPSRAVTQVVSRSPRSRSSTLRRSSMPLTAVRGRGGLCSPWRQVTRCGASMQGRAAMMGGVRTAHGVPPSSMASDQRSSVGHSRGVDRAIDSPLVVTAVGAAVAATLWRRVTRYGDANCSDMNTRASYRPRAMRTKPNFEQSS